MLTNDKIAGFFTTTPAHMEGNTYLRDPQIEGYVALRGHLAAGGTTTTAVPPAGWEDRVVHLDREDSRPGYARCLEPHDLTRPRAPGPRPGVRSRPVCCSRRAG